MSQFTHEALLSDLTGYPRIVKVPTINSEGNLPAEKQPSSVDQAYITMLQTQNMMLQQSIMKQQGLANSTGMTGTMEPLQIGDPNAKAPVEKSNSDFGINGCCMFIMFISSAAIAMNGFVFAYQVINSSDYQTFEALESYVPDIEQVPFSGVQECAEFITFGYQSLFWGFGLIALAVIGGILSCIKPMISLIGATAFTIAISYFSQQVSNNGCSQVWSEISAYLQIITGIPDDDFSEVYGEIMQVAGVYAIILLVGVLAIHFNSKQ